MIQPLTPHQKLVQAHRKKKGVSLSPEENGLLLRLTPEIRASAKEADKAQRNGRPWRGKAVPVEKHGVVQQTLLKLKPGERLPITKRSQVVSLRQVVRTLQKKGADIDISFVSSGEGESGYVVAGTRAEIATLRKHTRWQRAMTP